MMKLSKSNMVKATLAWRWFKKNYVSVINWFMFIYVLINPDRIGTWIGKFLLNIQLVLGL